MDQEGRSTIKRSAAGTKKHSIKKETMLSTIQKQQVDSIFESMFGYGWGTTLTLVSDFGEKDNSCRMLKRMFGSKGAAQILFKLEKRRRRIKLLSTSSIQFDVNDRRSTVTNLRKMGTKAVGTHEKSALPSVSASVDGPPSTSDPSPCPPPVPSDKAPDVSSSGVDSLLEQMQDKKPTSTIMRTAMAWEVFKEQSGILGEKLEEHAESKGAYLKRQDFLNRVDNRKFEHEREQRERNRNTKS